MILRYKFEDNIYEYEIDDDEVVEQFMREFGTSKVASKDIIDEFDLWDELQERYEYDLTVAYEDEAFEQYKEDIKYDKDPEDFYGVSRKYD